MKSALRKSLGRRSLTRSELETSLHEVEACLNSRPLTFVGDEPDDVAPLTPSHFLIGRPAGLPAGVGDAEFSSVDLVTRREALNEQLDEFWQRWTDEYVKNLPLCSGANVQEVVKVGTVVLIREDGLPRLRWPTGVIQAVFPGKDGVVRAVEVKTSKGVYKRPVQRLHILEAASHMYDHTQDSEAVTETLMGGTQNVESGATGFSVTPSEPFDSSPKQTTTRCGRVVKPKLRLDL